MTNLFHFFRNQKRFLKKFLFSALPLFLFNYSMIAQGNIQIKGLVVDVSTQEAIVGAVIQLKNDRTQSGTATDAEGRFTFTTQSLPATILVSYIGYKSQEIEVYEVSDKPILIPLPPSNNSLNEVVVIGYGTQKREELSGSIATIPSSALDKPISSLDNALIGTSPGVQAAHTSGQPGGGISIRIRGGSSIQGGNEPLFVIDGFPINNTSNGAGVLSGAGINPLAEINSSDIESITILKDASATAIYGSRGANGVVIVTTKQGKTDKSVVTYEGSIGVQQLRKKIDLLNAHDFAILRNEALYDKAPGKGTNQYLSEEEIALLGAGTDWQDAAFRLASVQNHQLSISGGNSKTRYLISGGYFDQDGILIKTDFKRINGRVNLTSEISDHLKVGVNLSASKSDANVAPSGTISAVLTMPATATIREEDGSYTLRNPFENIISNPIASLNEQLNKTTNNRLLGTAYGEYEFLKNLKLKISLGADVKNNKEKNYIPSTTYEGSAANGIASLGSANAYSWLNENTLTYATVLNQKHSIDALLGFTQQEYSFESASAGSQNFTSDALAYNNLAAGSIKATPKSDSNKWGLISYLARINYGYDNRYFLSASLRADGSSKFGKNNKWGYFPSIGFSWGIYNEKFFNRDGSISDLKLRISYGKTGNQEIGVYQSLSTLSTVNYVLNGTQIIGFVPDRIANDNLGWEKTGQFDFGTDIGFWDNRLLLTADFYYKKTSDLLLNVEIPWTTGHSSSLQNYGSVENKGFELGIQYDILSSREWKWNANFNISSNRNKVIKINDGADSYISGNYIVQVGKPLGSFYGCVTDGILQENEIETKGSFTGKATPKAGDQLYKDVDGNGSFSNGSDRAIIGNAEADFIAGLTNTISYRNWDLSLFIQGSYGNDILNSNKQTLELFTGQQNASASALNRWTSTNTQTDVPRASSDPSTIFSDRYVEDGSFLRLKSLTIGYTIPKTFAGKIKLSNVKFYLNGENLLTWTKYSGFDPEVNTGNNVSPGTDAGIYPVARTFNAGIKVTF